MSLAPGTRLGPYNIVALLGRGGMGEVYRARDARLGREVALKVLSRGPAEDREHRRRFEREAKAASSLSHPNVAQIFDVGVEDGTFYLAMELVEGRTLRQLLRREEDGKAQRLAVGQLLELGGQIARGVARAHQRGVVHRDLKPENVMVTPEGWVKILDFGLAKLTNTWLEGGADEQTIDHAPTRVGQLLGTAEYMSPEQAAGRRVDHRSDQFALGSLLYEMTTGKFAFRRESPVLTLAAVLEREPTPLREAGSGNLIPGLEAVINRCLRKQPEDRYATTDELVAALEAVAAGTASDDSPTPPGSEAPLTSQAREILERTEHTGGALGELRKAAFEVRDELGDELGFLPSSRYYFVEGRHGVSKRFTDRQLIERVRRAHYGGDQRVRRGDQREWTALADTELFRMAAPSAAELEKLRKKHLGGFAAHATAFTLALASTAVIQATGWSIIVGDWSELAIMAVWGVGLAVHGLSARRTVARIRRYQGARPEQPARTALPSPARAGAETNSTTPQQQREPPIATDFARVRALLDERGGDDAPLLLAELARLEAVLSELERRRDELALQVSDGERARLVAAADRARSALEGAASAAGRHNHEEQLQTIRERLDALDQARAERDRVSIRLDLATHQLKKLRLDLTRGAAAALDTPELSSRLQVIRDEADAAESD